MKRNAEGQVVSVTSSDLIDILSSWTAVKERKAGVPEDADINEEMLRDMLLMLTRNNVPDGTEIQVMQIAQFMDKPPLKIFKAILQIQQLPGLPDLDQTAESIQQIHDGWLKTKARFQIEQTTFEQMISGLEIPEKEKFTISSMEAAVIGLINNMNTTGRYEPNAFQAAALQIMAQLTQIAQSMNSDVTSLKDYAKIFKQNSHRRALNDEINLLKARHEKLSKDINSTKTFLSNNESLIMGQKIKVDELQAKLEARSKSGGTAQTDPVIASLTNELKAATSQLETHAVELKRLQREESTLEKEKEQIEKKIEVIYGRMRG